MRRPTITRKRIDGLFVALSFAQGDIEAMTGDDQKDCKKDIDAFESACAYVSELSHWHRWKQEQNKELEG
tara:strand:+ start:897 stop:1106 length:210 start_codon:yes stop_codon:yes gene_type:complete